MTLLTWVARVYQAVLGEPKTLLGAESAEGCLLIRALTAKRETKCTKREQRRNGTII
jgi:hypothetical protein